MKRLLALPTGFASRICAPCSVLLMLTSAAALAQSTDAANPPPAPAPSSAPDATSAGCEPIGLTASGEIVLPFRCKDVVERQRAAAAKSAEPKPTVSTQQEKSEEKSQERPQVKSQEKHHATSQQKPQAQPVVSAAKTAAMHPAGTAQRKPAVRPVGAAHLPKTAEAKSGETNSDEANADEAKGAEAKPVEATKGAQQVAGGAHEHGMGPPGCMQFQSYNAVSATYLGFDGQRHPCRAVVGQVARNQVAGNQAARTQLSHKPSPADIKH
jgi:BA14K-like protein